MKKKLVLTKDRPSTSISMRMPIDLLEKLKKIARLKEMSGYQSVIKYYIGQGLLRDADLVHQIEAGEAEEEAARLEAAFIKIGLERDKVEAFLERVGSPPIDETGNRGQRPNLMYLAFATQWPIIMPRIPSRIHNLHRVVIRGHPGNGDNHV